jgi:hypothetical protein
MEIFEWHVESRPYYGDGVQVWAFRQVGDYREHLASMLAVQRIEKHQMYEGGPTFKLTSGEAQQLMNGLWQAGLRPRDGAGSLAHVDAQKAHLEDMRRLVFDAKP